MDQKIPFTSYDFWAYLSAGTLLMFAIDSSAGGHLILRKDWTVAQGVVAIALAYVVGQLVAGLSSLILERWLVAKTLGNPRAILLGQIDAPVWTRKLLPSYFAPLPTETRAALEAKTTGSASSDAQFWSAFAHARSAPSVMGRLDNFLNQYGFCRNIALVALIDAGIWYWAYRQTTGLAEHLWWSRVSLVVSLGMALRYLKFYRLYANEVYTAFAYSKADPK